MNFVINFFTVKKKKSQEISSTLTGIISDYTHLYSMFTEARSIDLKAKNINLFIFIWNFFYSSGIKMSCLLLKVNMGLSENITIDNWPRVYC